MPIEIHEIIIKTTITQQNQAIGGLVFSEKEKAKLIETIRRIVLADCKEMVTDLKKDLTKR